MSGSSTRARSGRPWWRQAATLLGVVGLLVTLAFNTLAVRQSARQDREARDTAQVGLLTQLNSNATDSERAINDTPAVPGQCIQGSALEAPDAGAVRAALDYYEYLGWLFNRERLTVAGSRAFFSQRMISGWRLGRHYFGLAEMRTKYHELSAFVEATPMRDRTPLECNLRGTRR